MATRRDAARSVIPAEWWRAANLADLVRNAADTHKPGRTEPIIAVDTARVARQLRHAARVTVGLLPVGRDAVVHPLAVELGFALALVTQMTSLVFDPEREGGAPPPDSASLLASRCEVAHVLTVAPRTPAPDGAKFEMVKLMVQFVDAEREDFGHVLVNLAGCRLPGELLGASRLLDGIILVGRSGKASADQLLDASRAVPDDLNLGVILTE